MQSKLFRDQVNFLQSPFSPLSADKSYLLFIFSVFFVIACQINNSCK